MKKKIKDLKSLLWTYDLTEEYISHPPPPIIEIGQILAASHDAIGIKI